MPSDAAISAPTPLPAVAPVAPAQRAGPGASEAPSFAVLLQGGEVADPLLPRGAVAPLPTEPALAGRDMRIAPTKAPSPPVIRAAASPVVTPPAEVPPHAQANADIPPELVLPVAPADLQLAEAMPDDAAPGEAVDTDVATAAQNPVMGDADPAIMQPLIAPITAEAPPEPPTIEIADAMPEQVAASGRGARLARADAPDRIVSDDALADDVPAQTLDGALSQEEVAAKHGARSVRTSAAKTAQIATDPAREATATSAVASSPSVDRSGAMVDLAVRNLYQTEPGATAAPATAAVVQAHSGQVGRDVGAAIKREIVSGREEVTVRLDPPELGRIHIRLSFDNAGQLRTVVATETAAALDLLRRDVHQLDRALAEAGVQTDAQSFRFDDRQAGSGFGRSGNQPGGEGASLPRGARAEREDHLPIRQALHGRVASGRVDMIA